MPRRPLLLAALAAVALVVVGRGVLFMASGVRFDVDQAVIGLMAKHIAEGRAYPLYFYGQDYLLALEAYGRSAAGAGGCAGDPQLYRRAGTAASDRPAGPAVPAADGAGLCSHRDAQRAAQEVQQLRLQGSAQSDQSARPACRLGGGI